MTKVFKKDHYHKVFGVDKEPDLTKEEKAASDYVNNQNRDEDFDETDELIMHAAFCAGVYWQKNRKK